MTPSSIYRIRDTKLGICTVGRLLISSVVLVGSAGYSIAAEVSGDVLESPKSESTEKPTSNKTYIEEVIVTATKRSKPLREIPASISAFSGDDLEKRGVQGVDDIVKLVPGVNLTSDLGISRITIRGIAPETGTNLTTGTLFGNISFSDTYVPLTALDPYPFDIESVEVLKGPQGTLFGASALNGAIRYVPERPVMDVWEAKYFWQYSEIEQGGQGITYGAALNVPLGREGRSAMRIVAFDKHDPGYIDNLKSGVNDSNETEQDGVRVILGWQPTDDWDIKLTYAEQQTQVADYALADNENGDLMSNNRARLSPTSNSYDFTALSIDRNLGWASVVYEAGYITKESTNLLDTSRSVGFNDQALTGLDFSSESETRSHELRLSSDDSHFSNWQWIGGIFGFQQSVKHSQSLVFGGESVAPAFLSGLLNGFIPGLGDLTNGASQAALLRIRPDVDVEEAAIFGEVTRFFGQNNSWELTLGGRYYKTKSSGVSVRDGLLILATTGSPQSVIRADVEEESFNPKASLLWHATEDILTYAAVSKGFRVGGVQAGVTLPISATQAPDVFQSDSIISYEIGGRSEWFDGLMNFDVTVFRIDWEDPQTIQRDSTGLTNYLDNVGGVESNGVDVSFQFQFPWVQGLSLRSSASFVDTETTADFQTGGGRVSQAGDPWPYAQDRQTVTSLSYFTNVYDWSLNAGITYTSMGEAVNNLAELRPIFDYEQWDAQLSLANSSLAWLPEVTLIAQNVSDERGVVNYIQQGSAADVTYIRPRTLSVRISGSF